MSASKNKKEPIIGAIYARREGAPYPNWQWIKGGIDTPLQHLDLVMYLGEKPLIKGAIGSNIFLFIKYAKKIVVDFRDSDINDYFYLVVEPD